MKETPTIPELFSPLHKILRHDKNTDEEGFPGFFLHYTKASAEFFSLLPSAEAFLTSHQGERCICVPTKKSS
jgi:hypothetical protein